MVLAGSGVGVIWARPAGVEEAERPINRISRERDARVATGYIRRDGATRAAIRATSAQPLPPRPRDSWRLVVHKSRYRLDLFDGLRLTRVFPLAFGGEPAGAKERMGDERTPEGEYVLIPHHQSPNFGSCFYVCYPGPGDAQRGYFAGLIDRPSWRDILRSFRGRERPPHRTHLGGLILIHGTRDRTRRGLTHTNWTQGCIAMENRDLLDLLGLFTPEDRPEVDIRP